MSANEELLAALSARWDTSKAAEDAIVDDVKRLLEAGADPNCLVDYDEDEGLVMTALYFTVHGGSPRVAEVLLEFGADPNVPFHMNFSGPDTSPTYPLHKAADRGHAPVVRALILAGAKLDALNYKDQTPASLAKKSDVVAIFSAAEKGDLK